MAIEIVDFPIKHGDFSLVILVYQRVTLQMVQVMHGKNILKKTPFSWAQEVIHRSGLPQGPGGAERPSVCLRDGAGTGDGTSSVRNIMGSYFGLLLIQLIIGLV